MPERKDTKKNKKSSGSLLAEGSSAVLNKVKNSVKSSINEVKRDFTDAFFDKLMTFAGIIFIAISVTILLSWFIGPALSFLIVGIVILIWSKLRR
ncbi:MAG: hypothetical protein ACQEP1_01660 [Nanobdellota archaeon]